MNTALLKTFGQQARTLLIDGVTRKLHYWGFDKDGKVTESPEALPGGYMFREGIYDDPAVPALWQKLKERIDGEGLHEVAERAAYVWFNRLMALRILEKNGYVQPLLQQVSEEEHTPAIVRNARTGVYDFLNKAERSRLQKILTDYEKETQVFALLLIGFCHSHPLINRVFGGIEDYTELLLPDDVLNPGGFLDLLNNSDYISDEDYKQVELIGWLYQFYISEKKDQVFKQFKNGKKAEAKDIPAATQIFTPNWIVKYMVENTVGNIWLDKHPASPIKADLKYLVEAPGNNETPDPIIEEVKDLKLLDPAAGSGHILVEGFDLLLKMYLEEYYPVDEAVESILQHNLYGLDIDLRAAQLAQFAVLMKAAHYYPDILTKDAVPHIYAMPAPVHFTKEDVQLFAGKDGALYVKPLHDALQLMLQAQNLGSIMQFDISDEARTYILNQWKHWQERNNLDLLEQELLSKLTPYLQVLEVLTQQYEAIAANPPYMGQKNMNGSLKSYTNAHYPNTKADLFGVFMEICSDLLCNEGRYGMINQHSWMFLTSFETWRIYIIENYTIESLLHLGAGTFEEITGEVVQSTTFVIRKKEANSTYTGTFHRLIKCEARSREKMLLDGALRFSNIKQKDFKLINGSPISYWISKRIHEIFTTNQLVKDLFQPKQGMSTGKNDLFLRKFFEVSKDRIGFPYDKTKRWQLYYKGGGYRKWFGEDDYLINWGEEGTDVSNFKGSVIRNRNFYFKKCLSWTLMGTESFAVRENLPAIFDAGSSSLFLRESQYAYVFGLINSIVVSELLQVINPTSNFSNGVIGSIPVVLTEELGLHSEVDIMTKRCVAVSAKDWYSKEPTWFFQSNPILIQSIETLESAFKEWQNKISGAFFQLHHEEEELNRIFIDIYGLRKELTPEVPLKDITILQDELDYEALEKLEPPYEGQLVPIKKEVPIQQLISYAVGCFMGRYRLDKPGLQIAHPNSTAEEIKAYPYTSEVTQQSHLFEIDEDGIVPIMGNRGNFRDDAYNRLREFLKIIWGDDTLTQNINFMQECLNQDLEDYLVKKFWAFHVRMYSKKPIYWLFSSKKGAFQALVYMHRMNRFTAEKLRDKYLLKHIQFLEQEIGRMEGNMTALSKTDQKKLDALRKDLQECNEYDLLLKDIATKQIEFDLDDGVTRNYELFKSVVAPIK